MLINGTFDWVYEEELDLRDGWRWSPDGQRIAYWQLNTDGVLSFDLINDTDSLYSFVTPVQYPKAGESNSAARVGVVSAAGRHHRWLPFEGDPREHYPARMEWADQLDRARGAAPQPAAEHARAVPRRCVDRAAAHDPHRARQHLGRRGERPHLAQQAGRASPG